MYFMCRVVISNYFGWVMLQAVLADKAPTVSILLFHLSATSMLHRKFYVHIATPEKCLNLRTNDCMFLQDPAI